MFAHAQRPKDLAEMMTHFVTWSTTTTAGDWVGIKREVFQRKPLEDFFGLAELEQSVTGIDVTVLPDEHARIVGVLREHLSAWKIGADLEDS